MGGGDGQRRRGERPRGLILGRGKPDLNRSLGAELIDQFAAAIPIW